MAPEILFTTADEWRRWLKHNHASADGLWVRFAKKASHVTSVTYRDALDEALCWGWIDGQVKRGDADTWLRRFTPRRKTGAWSKLNCERAERLIAEGRMEPPGLAEVETAKADGRWNRAYAPASKIQIPDDLAAAFRANRAAATFFQTLTGQNRYAVLYRIHAAKRQQTRSARIQKFVAMLAEGRTIHPERASIEPRNRTDKNTA